MHPTAPLEEPVKSAVRLDPPGAPRCAAPWLPRFAATSVCEFLREILRMRFRIEVLSDRIQDDEVSEPSSLSLGTKGSKDQDRTRWPHCSRKAHEGDIVEVRAGRRLCALLPKESAQQSRNCRSGDQ